MNWNELIGRQFGHYIILDELGRGGSSRVYRAHDTAAGGVVAIKILSNDAEDRAGFVQRFDREVQAVAQLDHPNIVAVYDRGETEDLVYLVMQLVAGGTLRARMGRPLPIPEATAAIMQMAQALHHAHLRGIIHRDVKPSNMLLDADDPRHVLLTDFGIAKLQGFGGLTKSGTTVGTPEYMSPEQAEGKEIDQRADVYSLGCVLYEALAGRPPFIGATAVSVLYQQVHTRPPYLRGFNAEVPRELARIVEQTLAKRPEERFGTAERLAEALSPYAEGALPAPQAQRERTISGPAAQIYGPHATVARRDAAMPSGPTRRGLGEEGLDALFPEEPAMNPAAPPRRANQTIPLPSFRLPAKPTHPLTAEGTLDLEALLARLEAQRANSSQSRTSQEATPPVQPDAPAGALASFEALESEALESDERSLPAWLMPAAQPPETEAVGAAGSGNGGGTPRGRPARSPASPRGGRTQENTAQPGPARRRGGKPLWMGAAIAAALVLALAIGVVFNASALGLVLRPQLTATRAVSTRTLAPTAQLSPTPTSTPAAKPTATPNPQTALNQQAAASFRAIVLGLSRDQSCSGASAATHFAVGATVYVNLCTSAQALDVPTTVTIRQSGRVVYTLASNYFMHASASYYFYRLNIPAGTYHMVVTQQINGGSGVAADIRFTAG